MTDDWVATKRRQEEQIRQKVFADQALQQLAIEVEHRRAAALIASTTLFASKATNGGVETPDDLDSVLSVASIFVRWLETGER